MLTLAFATLLGPRADIPGRSPPLNPTRGSNGPRAGAWRRSPIHPRDAPIISRAPKIVGEEGMIPLTLAWAARRRWPRCESPKRVVDARRGATSAAAPGRHRQRRQTSIDLIALDPHESGHSDAGIRKSRLDGVCHSGGNRDLRLHRSRWVCRGHDGQASRPPAGLRRRPM
jgi:hypothetical protein